MIIRDILTLKGNALFTITPGATLTEAVSSMVKNDIGSLVVMSSGRMAGMLTFREVLASVEQNGGNLGNVKVGDVMVKEPIIGGPEDTVDYVRSVMTDHHVRYLPVMESDTLLGVISFHDVAKAAIQMASFENRLLKRYIKNWPE